MCFSKNPARESSTVDFNLIELEATTCLGNVSLRIFQNYQGKIFYQNTNLFQKKHFFYIIHCWVSSNFMSIIYSICLLAIIQQNFGLKWFAEKILKTNNLTSNVTTPGLALGQCQGNSLT